MHWLRGEIFRTGGFIAVLTCMFLSYQNCGPVNQVSQSSTFTERLHPKSELTCEQLRHFPVVARVSPSKVNVGEPFELIIPYTNRYKNAAIMFDDHRPALDILFDSEVQKIKLTYDTPGNHFIVVTFMSNCNVVRPLQKNVCVSGPGFDCDALELPVPGPPEACPDDQEQECQENSDCCSNNCLENRCMALENPDF